MKPIFNVYSIERFARDIGGSGDRATGDRSLFRYTIDDYGEVSTEGSRYGSGHWSKTTPEEAVHEIVEKFEGQTPK